MLQFPTDSTVDDNEQEPWTGLLGPSENHHTGGENKRCIFLQSGRVEVSADLVSPEASLLGVQMAIFPVSPHMAFLVCVGIPGVSLWVQYSSYRDSSQNGLGPTLMALF